MLEKDETGEKLMVTGTASKIEIYRGWCKKCAICVAFCPRQVLSTDDAGYPVIKDMDRCTGCNLCADRCPDFAITVCNGKEIYEKAENSDKTDDKQASSSGK
jgi:NAD-dependent dihydropyrimidine dehydrogenase PreA subunit